MTMDTCIDGTVDSEEIKGAQLLEIEMGLPEKITLRMSNKSTGSESTRAVKK